MNDLRECCSCRIIEACTGDGHHSQLNSALPNVESKFDSGTEAVRGSKGHRTVRAIMTLTKKGTKPVQLPKSSLVYQRYKQAEAERRKAEEIERMIEAKVNMALRRLLH